MQRFFWSTGYRRGRCLVRGPGGFVLPDTGYLVVFCLSWLSLGFFSLPSFLNVLEIGPSYIPSILLVYALMKVIHVRLV